VPGKRKNERPLTEEGEDAMDIDSDHLQVSISDPTLKPRRIPFDASKRADHTQILGTDIEVLIWCVVSFDLSFTTRSMLGVRNWTNVRAIVSCSPACPVADWHPRHFYAFAAQANHLVRRLPFRS